MLPLPSILDHAHRFTNRHIHFLQIHYFYILLIILLFSGLFYCPSGTTWAYIDALYMATTSCTNTGVNTIPLSTMSTYQVMVLYFSSLAGSHILVSLVVVMVRKYYFNKRFREVVLFNKARKARELQRRRQNSITSNNSGSKPNNRPVINVLLHSGSHIGDQDMEPGIIGPLTMPLEHQHQHHLRQLRPQQQQQQQQNTAIVIDEPNAGDDGLAQQQLGSDEKQPHFSDARTTTGGANIIFADNIIQQREAARQRLEAQRKLEDGKQESWPTDNHQPQPQPSGGADDNDTTDILSLAQDQMELTREQRYYVGGAEYRALDLLTIVIPSYYVGTVLCASLAFRLYIAVSPYAQHVLLVTNSGQAINPWSLSFFISLSAMNNLGLSQIDASMVPFQSSPFPLLVCGFLVLAGNTAYPIFLRFTLWLLYRLTPKSYSMHRETLRYLLDHPRRCYTTLFPAAQTWWLLAILIAINLTEVVVYVSTNYWLPVMDGIPIASQLLDALFQGIATRNGNKKNKKKGSLGTKIATDPHGYCSWILSGERGLAQSRHNPCLYCRNVHWRLSSCHFNAEQ
jgi:hypothetical protein